VPNVVHEFDQLFHQGRFGRSQDAFASGTKMCRMLVFLLSDRQAAKIADFAASQG
jgi:hypothetical protein